MRIPDILILKIANPGIPEKNLPGKNLKEFVVMTDISHYLSIRILQKNRNFAQSFAQYAACPHIPSVRQHRT